MRPYYRAENLNDLQYLDTLPGEFPYTRGTKADNNRWEIVQEVEEADPAKANAIAVDALGRGATTIAFNASRVENADALETLLAGIDLQQTGVQFNHVKSYLDLATLLTDYIHKHNIDPEKVSGSINFDPLTYRLKHNKFYHSEQEDMMQAVELIKKMETKREFKLINVNGITLHNAGATIVQELGYTLALANEYIAFCTEHGIEPAKVASRIQLTLSVGSNYFMEIAKLRAARLLWSTMVEQYKPECPCAYRVRINTVASTWNKTTFDPYVNMLRSTTEGMSAVIGGTDALSLQPFDVTYKESDEFSRRIARNVQVLLKEESFFDRVVDPAAGSYYIETLTNSIAEQVWKLFQEVESAGGALKAIADGTIQAAIEKSCQKRDMDIATRRYILLGTNNYPNINEKMLDKIERMKSDDSEGLKSYRGALGHWHSRNSVSPRSATPPRTTARKSICSSSATWLCVRPVPASSPTSSAVPVTRLWNPPVSPPWKRVSRPLPRHVPTSSWCAAPTRSTPPSVWRPPSSARPSSPNFRLWWPATLQRPSRPSRRPALTTLYTSEPTSWRVSVHTIILS